MNEDVEQDRKKDVRKQYKNEVGCLGIGWRGAAYIHLEINMPPSLKDGSASSIKQIMQIGASAK